MTKYKKQELSEEEVDKAKLDLAEASTDDDKEMSDEESDKETEDKDKKDKKPFDEKCKDKVKEHLIQKENISEIKTMIPEGVSEEFVENFDTVVVGLINEQVQKISDALIADFMEEMDLSLEEAVDAHKEYIDKFISVELDSFKESQKEALISSIKVEKAEKFLSTLKSIFSENHFILDEEKLSQVATAETKVAQLESEINKHYDKIASLNEIINEKEIALQINELTSSMTELDKSRLTTMLESVDKKDSANYIKEAQKLKSFLLNETIKTSKETEVLDVVTEGTVSDETNLSLNELLNKWINKV